MDHGYRVALLDWLACAVRGTGEPAARAATAAGDRVVALGTAGHVLDFDDTSGPGLAHLSAPTAPAALVVGAEAGATVGEALAAYADGFEAMGALARASHPALYDAGWHPTAVCGTLGAAVVAARLLDLDTEAQRSARAIALLRASGLRAAFGSDGKALQVGMAAAAGVQAARLAAGGALVDLDRVAHDSEGGFPASFAGARYAEPGDERAVALNWIKPYPCCLQAHAPIETALAARDGLRGDESLEVVVHPVSRRAAAIDDPADGLQAKFSIAYLVAFAALNGAPAVDDFAAIDAAARDHARERVRVTTDSSLAESAAVLRADGAEVARVEASSGSPSNPLDDAQRAAKVRALSGDALDGALDDDDRPVAELLARLP